MSAAKLIERFKALPAEERSRVARYVVENDDSWIPQAFKAGISEADNAQLVDLETALNQPYPGA